MAICGALALVTTLVVSTPGAASADTGTASTAACVVWGGVAHALPVSQLPGGLMEYYVWTETQVSGCTAPELSSTFTPFDIGTPYACNSGVDPFNPLYYPQDLQCYEPDVNGVYAVAAPVFGGYEVNAVFAAYYGGKAGSCGLALDYSTTSCTLW
jgi:hypothetical protein